jgi:glycosyltransferase involved in cell wall biosynthesis
LKHIIFTVTNDLNYDQRMIRICTSLANNGYKVTLIGLEFKTTSKINPRIFEQRRIKMLISKGPLFYIEYNIKLFLLLLFKSADAFCCIDLDTIMPVYLVALIKNKHRVYDAHEYFSQLKEIVARPKVYKVWHTIEKIFVKRFKNGYTVCTSIADIFNELYKVKYEVVRNIPLKQTTFYTGKKIKNIVYQGAVNEGRGFEILIPAMQKINAVLHVYGDGNYLVQSKVLIEKYNLGHKIILEGKLLPEDLLKITHEAYIGINLVQNTGLNQYYSLANKFFDYIQNDVPQITMNYPEYKFINDKYGVAYLIDDLEIETVSSAISELLDNETLYEKLKQNCTIAAKELNWQNEEKTLLAFYANLFE